MSTLARLQLLRTSRATALFCTPTYAQRLVEVARENAFDLSTLDVRVIVVAGEPGGSIPAIRDPIEAAFGAKISDHCGATEVGPWGFADKERRGQHVIESEFIAEFLSLEGDRPPATGELAQLVLTSLGRFGAPVIRYRTGDIVRPAWPEKGPCRFVLLDGGILGRIDDMLVIRGVNIFPSSIEAILREFDHVVEFRLTARKRGAMDELTLEVEDRSGDTSPIARALETRLGLRVDVALAPADSLPRFEGKGKRFVDER
jgi:phenylacetate-CoA ligase